MGLGGLLITTAITPTPDDVSVISPALQFFVGLGLVAAGALKGR